MVCTWIGDKAQCLQRSRPAQKIVGSGAWSSGSQPVGWVTKQIDAVIITHKFVSKLLSNSPIISNNHELRNIVVNKGRIHREIREF